MQFTIETEREIDGRWIAEILEIPGSLAYGKTREEANENAFAIAHCEIARRRPTT